MHEAPGLHAHTYGLYSMRVVMGRHAVHLSPTHAHIDTKIGTRVGYCSMINTAVIFRMGSEHGVM